MPHGKREISLLGGKQGDDAHQEDEQGGQANKQKNYTVYHKTQPYEQAGKQTTNRANGQRIKQTKEKQCLKQLIDQPHDVAIINQSIDTQAGRQEGMWT